MANNHVGNDWNHWTWFKVLVWMVSLINYWNSSVSVKLLSFGIWHCTGKYWWLWGNCCL